MRAYVEDRGTIEKAYAEIGVSRATLFNWFDRDRPPPGEAKIERLRQYLGNDAAWILDGVQENVEARPSDHIVNDPRELDELNGSVSASALRERIRAQIDELLAAAGDDSVRLAWIYEQMKQHLTPRRKWSEIPEFREIIGVAEENPIAKPNPELHRHLNPPSKISDHKSG